MSPSLFRPAAPSPDLLLSSKLAKDRLQTDLLESYWLAHKPSDTPPEPMVDRGPHSRSQSISDGILMRHSDHRLSPHHPIWSLTKLLDRFGPLIFPIYRAALLRKRILISCHAPVRPICDFGQCPEMRRARSSLG